LQTMLYKVRRVLHFEDRTFCVTQESMAAFFVVWKSTPLEIHCKEADILSSQVYFVSADTNRL
jgi:hypothetical protein